MLAQQVVKSTICRNFESAVLSLAQRHEVLIPNVTSVLDQLVSSYGALKQVTVDNGPEFAGQVPDAWAYAHGVTLDFIEPGKPTQNAQIGSFNDKFRDECLDLHWFGSLAHARTISHAWKEDYNTQRPHSALQQQAPAVYAQSLATPAQNGDGCRCQRR